MIRRMRMMMRRMITIKGMMTVITVMIMIGPKMCNHDDGNDEL